jgi:hypothetical protein
MTRRWVWLTLFFLPLAAGAATIRNDDSCDIAQLPAATLLLPYFEVDLEYFGGETTLFTVTNVTNVDRIARVTLWTDYAQPVLTFNIFLTGYDVQAINLFDVIGRGLIAPDSGTGTGVSTPGKYSDRNPDYDFTGCGRLPGTLSAESIARMRGAFTTGRIPAMGNLPACREIGGTHENAIGYATIDVVRTCSAHLPTDREYWTEDIAFDNVLIGDYHQVYGAQNFAQTNAMVHIRAVPEGGSPAQRRARPQDFQSGFPRTFYSRYQAASEAGFDARQPLPSTFAARWISGGAGNFQTSYKIWREGRTDGRSCGSAAQEAELSLSELVRFDEAENGAGTPDYSLHQAPLPSDLYLPATSRTYVDDRELYPQLTNGAVAGWLYLNLDRCAGSDFPCTDEFATQNWVVTSMRAEGRYSGDADAVALGNGCSLKSIESEASYGSGVIGPAPNTNP